MNKQSNDGENKDGGGSGGCKEGGCDWQKGNRKSKQNEWHLRVEAEAEAEARTRLNKCPDKECHKYVCENYADVQIDDR